MKEKITNNFSVDSIIRMDKNMHMGFWHFYIAHALKHPLNAYIDLFRDLDFDTSKMCACELRMRICEDSPKPPLLDNSTCTKISCAVSILSFVSVPIGSFDRVIIIEPVHLKMNSIVGMFMES